MDWQVGCTGTSFMIGMKIQWSFWKYASWLSEIVDFGKLQIWPNFPKDNLCFRRTDKTPRVHYVWAQNWPKEDGLDSWKKKRFEDYYKQNDVLFWVGHLSQLRLDQWLWSNKAVWDEIYHFLFSYWLLLVIFIKHPGG